MKKRLLSLLLALALCLGIMVPAYAATDTLSGTYTGYYYAAQGQTGLTLTILSADKGIFEFYNLDGYTNAEPGSYYVSISYADDQVIIEGTEWIEKPSSYSFVSLYGTVDGTDFSGKVNNSSSWPFQLTQNGSVTLPEETSPSETTIPDNAVSFEGHSYLVLDSSLTWISAERYCESLGGHLATINSEAEQDFVYNLISDGSKNNYWLGGYRGSDQNFAWITEESFSYTNWDSGEPNDGVNSTEDYLSMYRIADPDKSQSTAGCWNDVPDTGEINFYDISQFGLVCEWGITSESEASGVTTSIPDEAVKYNGHYYMAYTDSMYWKDAEEYCESLGGHLVTITSQEEQSFLEDYLSYQNNSSLKGKYMIGMHRTYTGFETWVTGEAVTYTNWGLKEPDNMGGSQNPVIFNNGSTLGSGGSSYQIAFGQWDDDSESRYRFICEWDKISTSYDSETSRWSTPEMEKAYDMDLVPDSLIGEDLTEPITRLEFAAVSVKVYESLAGVSAIPAIVNPFTDCSDVEMLKAYNVGITNGTSATTFEPDELLNREQAATMLTRVFKRVTIPGWTLATDSSYPLSYTMPTPFADDAKISRYAKDSVYFMAANGIINGIGNNTFAPKNTTTTEEANQYANATREQALAIAVRMVEKLG